MAKTNRRAALRVEGEDRKSHRHSTNPFTDGWQPETVSKHKRINLDKRPPIYDEAGEQIKGRLLVDFERDGERFVKLVRAALSEMGPLSSTSRAVLDYAMYQALPGNAVVWMPAADALVFCRFKQPKSFYDGVNELIIYEFLARTEKQGFYFLNPQKFFNGNRSAIKNNFSKPKN